MLTLLAAGDAGVPTSPVGHAGVSQSPPGSLCPSPEHCQARPAMPQPATPMPWPSPAQGDHTQTPSSLVTAPSATRQCLLATTCPQTHWPHAHLPKHRAEMGKRGLEPPRYPEPHTEPWTAPLATVGLIPEPRGPDGHGVLRSRSSPEPLAASPAPAAPSPPGEPDGPPGSSVAIRGASPPSREQHPLPGEQHPDRRRRIPTREAGWQSREQHRHPRHTVPIPGSSTPMPEAGSPPRAPSPLPPPAAGLTSGCSGRRGAMLCAEPAHCTVRRPSLC